MAYRKSARCHLLSSSVGGEGKGGKVKASHFGLGRVFAQWTNLVVSLMDSCGAGAHVLLIASHSSFPLVPARIPSDPFGSLRFPPLPFGSLPLPLFTFLGLIGCRNLPSHRPT